MHDLTLTAPDISCEHCKKTIEGGLSTKDGVYLVSVDIPAMTIHIEYDGAAIDRATLEAELDGLGYPVS